MAQNLYNDFINFFKKHGIYNENIFKHINDNKVIFDYLDEERNYQIGYHPIIKEGILTDVIVYVPFINNQKTLLINIYVYMHAIQLCKYLGKKINLNNNTEVLSMLYERIYVNEINNHNLETYLNTLDEKTKVAGSPKQKAALTAQKELLKYYQEQKPTYSQMKRKAKKYIRRH